MQSCVYEGTVTHCRREPVTHRFQHRLFMVCLDLDELPSLIGRRGLIASNRSARCSFLRRDHLFDHSRPLDAELRDIISSQTGQTLRGPIRLLTQLRHFGFYFSPLNLFYVYDERDVRVECVVAEVNNTPWNERHCYVLWDGNRNGGVGGLHFSHPKEFHVSPFLGMDMEYRWQLTEPGESLTVRLANIQSSRRVFDAAMTLRRRELSERQLRQMTLRYPLITAQISAAIYYQAFRLWLKKCPFHTHPKKQNSSKPMVAASPSQLPADRTTMGR